MVNYSSVALVFAVVANLMVNSGEALSCSDINAAVTVCGAYVTGSVPQPSAECCDSVGVLHGMLNTTADERSYCNCLKQSSSSFPAAQVSNIYAIPQKCGIPVSIPADPNFDCDSINEIDVYGEAEEAIKLYM